MVSPAKSYCRLVKKQDFSFHKLRYYDQVMKLHIDLTTSDQYLYRLLFTKINLSGFQSIIQNNNVLFF